MSPRKLVLLALVVVGIALAMAGSLIQFMMSPPKPGDTQTLVVEVRRGERPSEIAKDLESKGAITDAKKLVWLGRLTRSWAKIKAGEYGVSPGMTPLQVLGIIKSGITLKHPLTVREGENLYEIAADYQAKGYGDEAKFIALCKDPKFIQSIWPVSAKAAAGAHSFPQTLEGYLFPDTYLLEKTLSTEDLIKQMVKRFYSVWTPEHDAAARAFGFTRHQAVTLASMIEKETGAPQERPMISSVFHNRLKKKMRLQSDPTTIYGIWDRYDGNLHHSDLASVNNYNTYVVPALPIGPIANPGREAIDAALKPVTSEFLFFVSHNDGTHEFTKTFGEHTAAVKKFQLDPKAREGKSWRDLKRSKAATN